MITNIRQAEQRRQQHQKKKLRNILKASRKRLKRIPETKAIVCVCVFICTWMWEFMWTVCIWCAIQSNAYKMSGHNPHSRLSQPVNSSSWNHLQVPYARQPQLAHMSNDRTLRSSPLIWPNTNPVDAFYNYMALTAAAVTNSNPKNVFIFSFFSFSFQFFFWFFVQFSFFFFKKFRLNVFSNRKL